MQDRLEYPGEALVRIGEAPIEVPFNLISGQFNKEWSSLARMNEMMHMEEEAYEKELNRIDGELFQLRSSEEVSSQDRIEELETQKMTLEVYGCMGVWVYGCMGVWVYGCMGIKSLDELERLHVCLSCSIHRWGEKGMEEVA